MNVLLASGWSMPSSFLQPLARLLRAEVSLRDAEPLPALSAPCVLAGWSLGGLHALQSALAQPEHVRACILLSSTARFCEDPASGWPGQPAAVVRAMRRGLQRDPNAVVDAFRTQAATPGTPPPGTGAPTDGPPLEQGLQALEDLDLRATLRGLRVPVLMLHGERDLIIAASNAHATHALLPQSTLFLHPDTGHLLPVHAADWCAASINRFLAELPP